MINETSQKITISTAVSNETIRQMDKIQTKFDLKNRSEVLRMLIEQALEEYAD